MIGQNFTITQTYTFENKEALLNVLAHDGIGKTNIIDDCYQKVIEYQIDKGFCVRLNDLIYGIQSNFIKFHLGQLMLLLNQLITKVRYLQMHNIEHEYLDLNRIWLQLKPGYNAFNIVYTKVQYTVHFTGYQCPFYEDISKEKSTFQDSIKSIIFEILTRCKGKIKLAHKNQPFIDRVNNEIYQPILNLCQSDNLNNLQIQINNILNNYNTEQQRLTQFDNDGSLGFKRGNRVYNVHNDLTKIMKNTMHLGYRQQEITYHFAIPFFSKKIAEKITYSSEQFNYSIIDEWIKRIQEMIRDAIEHDDFLKKQIISELESEIKESERNFKFNFTKEDRDQIVEDVYSTVKHLKVLNYYWNSIWLYISDEKKKLLESFIHVIIAKKANKILKSRFLQLMELKILEFILELI